MSQPTRSLVTFVVEHERGETLPTTAMESALRTRLGGKEVQFVSSGPMTPNEATPESVFTGRVSWQIKHLTDTYGWTPERFNTLLAASIEHEAKKRSLHFNGALP